MVTEPQIGAISGDRRMTALGHERIVFDKFNLSHREILHVGPVPDFQKSLAA